MDKASEWAIYWRIVLPLSLPAIAVLAIFSVMWRWNDFLWPLDRAQHAARSTLCRSASMPSRANSTCSGITFWP